MSIKSNPFGGVTLSGKDAEKFKNQVLYGKPNQAAKNTVKRGVALSRKFQRDGFITFVLKPS